MAQRAKPLDGKIEENAQSKAGKVSHEAYEKARSLTWCNVCVDLDMVSCVVGGEGGKGEAALCAAPD